MGRGAAAFALNFNKILESRTFNIFKMDYLQQLYARIMGVDNEKYGIPDGMPRKVVGFGNVLLDHTVHLKDTQQYIQLLERYNLSVNTRAELDMETLKKVTKYAIANNDAADTHLGGSALNTMRILKRLGTEPLFFGAVGDDKQSEMVVELLKNEGMETRLQKVCDTPTGRCICLIHNDSLSLYANIAASSKFSEDYLRQVESEDNASFLRNPGNKQLFYIEGFFVPLREDVSKYVVRNYIQGRRRLALNLSADYIVKQNYNHMLYLAKNAFILFGNKDEFEAFRECWGVSSVEDLATELMKQSETPKIVVITNGPCGVTLITNYRDELSPPGDITFENFNVPRVQNLVDTTGCGDAFAAAFLHAWLEKRSLSECVRLASDIAAKVATQVGCNLL